MGKMMKRLFCTVLVVVMCMTAAPLNGFADLGIRADAAGLYDVSVTVDFSDYVRKWIFFTNEMPDFYIKPDVYLEPLEEGKGNVIGVNNVFVTCVATDGTETTQTIETLSMYPSEIQILNFYGVKYPKEIKIEYFCFDCSLDIKMIGISFTMSGGFGSVVADIRICESGSSKELYSTSVNVTSRNSSIYEVSGYKTAIDASLSSFVVAADRSEDNLFVVQNRTAIENHEVSQTQKIPSGYNFYEDSYNFENYFSVIPYGYFKTMYNDGKAWSLFTNKWLQGGVCFGMTYTTASLYNGLPSGYSIRNLTDKSALSIGKYSLDLSAFIDYAHIYQFSREFSSGTVWTDGKTVYNLVREYLNNDYLGVTIGMTKRDGSGGHRVLAVGIDGNDILIDDPNNMNDYERLTVNSDGTWSFSGLSGWNSSTCNIRYNLDYFGPYKFISTMQPLNVNDGFIDNSTIDKIAENSVSEYLSNESILLSINSDRYSVENNDIIKVEFENNGETVLKDAPELYWIDNSKTVTITNVDEENSEVEVAGNENVIKIKLDKSSEINITIDEEENIIETNIDSVLGESYQVDSVSFDGSSSPIELTVSGVASSTEITTTKTEKGLSVKGISDGRIILTKDNEIIATEEIKNAVGDIEIIYNKEGESDELEANYHSHSYTKAITSPTCDNPGFTTYTCSCNDTYTADEVPALGHTSSSWITDLAPTCTAEGSKHTECTVCEEVLETEAIEKLPHNYSTTETEATCEKGGFTTYTCSCGDTYTGDKTPAKGHNYVEGVCENCGESKVDNCTHLCHKSGFLGFIWKIVRFIIKLFRVSPVCDCGISHY